MRARCAGSCGGWGTACRPIARRMRGPIIPTATDSSSASPRCQRRRWRRGEPVISVDTKKKELIGSYKNGGRELAPTGRPILVNTHDFIDKELGQGDPVRDLRRRSRRGLGRVGITADTAQFAVAAIKAGGQAPRSQALPDRQDADDHRRLRRLQQLPHPPLEDRAATPGRPDRPDRSESCTTRPAPEVEQDRAPAVQLHLDQLARQTARQPPDRDRPDRLDHHHAPG